METIASKAEGAGFGVSSPAADEDYRPAQNLGCSDLKCRRWHGFLVHGHLTCHVTKIMMVVAGEL